MTVISSSKVKDKIVTHVVMPAGDLNERAAEAALESDSPRLGYHTATFDHIITEAELTEQLTETKPKVRRPPLKALVRE